MALPTTLSAAKLTLWIGNSNSPGTYTNPCGLNTKGINFSATTNDITVPDCTNPDLAAWVARVVQNLSAGIDGAGVLAVESFLLWQAYFFSAAPRKCRVIVDSLPTAGCGRFDGSFVMNTFNITGTLGNKIQIEIACQSDGEVIYTPIP